MWVVLLGTGAVAWAGMLAGSWLRGSRIENEDHANVRTHLLTAPPYVALFAASVFTPLVPGVLLWAGGALLLASFIVFVLAVTAFARTKRGVTRAGIYRFSRNPMYVSEIAIFAGLALMAWSASSLMGLLVIACGLWNLPVIHWCVLAEERYLEGRFGEEYLAYRREVRRYLGRRTASAAEGTEHAERIT